MKVWLATALACLLSIGAWAQEDPKAAVEPLKIARDTFYQDVSKFRAGTLSQAEVKQRMERNMLPLINFRKIGLRVMGKHRRAASEVEQDRFIKVLTDTLFDAYTTGLGGYDGEKLKIPDDVQLINPKLAVLDCRLSRPSGEDLPVQFTLGPSADNRWLIENVSIAGLNIGLLLREQFDSLVQSTGSVTGAIDSWSFESVSAK